MNLVALAMLKGVLAVLMMALALGALTWIIKDSEGRGAEGCLASLFMIVVLIFGAILTVQVILFNL